MTTLSPSAIDCGPLDNLTNGHLLNTTLNRIATYSCNSGYTLNGTQMRICQTSGRWSNAEPICNGQH